VVTRKAIFLAVCVLWAKSVAHADLSPSVCQSTPSPTDQWSIQVSTSEHKLELVNVGRGDIKTVFEWHQADCESFDGWSSDEKYFYFTMGKPLSSSFVLVGQKEVRSYENSMSSGPVLYPFPSGQQSSFIDNRYVWLEPFPSVKINRIDLILKKSDQISEGRAFSVSPDGSSLIIDRGSELIYKDLIHGTEVILDPIEKINQPPSADWPRSAPQGGYQLWGWKVGGTRFWYSKGPLSEGALCVLINKSQVVQTNIFPQEDEERILSLENGWLVETIHLQAGAPGLFQTVKPEERVLTIMALVSGNIVEVVRSVSRQFHPKFVTEGLTSYLEVDVEGDVARVPVSGLKDKVEAAFNQNNTFVKSAVLKNLRK